MLPFPEIQVSKRLRTDRCSHTQSNTSQFDPLVGEEAATVLCRSNNLRFCTSQSALFSRPASGYLPRKSLNIGCYIKEVTNQADRERCHSVSILQGRCLSLREPAPSALTSHHPAHAQSTCTCCGTHTIYTCKYRNMLHLFKQGYTSMRSSMPTHTHKHTMQHMQRYTSRWESTFTTWFNARRALMGAD